jgi:hypothetical protein
MRLLDQKKVTERAAFMVRLAELLDFAKKQIASA